MQSSIHLCWAELSPHDLNGQSIFCVAGFRRHFTLVYSSHCNISYSGGDRVGVPLQILGGACLVLCSA